MKQLTLVLHLLLFTNFAFSTDLPNERAQIEGVLESAQMQHGYPGISVAIAFEGQIHTDQIGYADISEGVSVNSETIFRIYSLTKGLTDILSTVLAVNEVVDLSAPIKAYLPDIPAHLGDITSHQLQSHTSGLRHYLGTDEWLQFSRKNCSSPSDAFSTFINDPLVSEIGAKENYSTFGYVLFSGVLEAAANVPFKRLMADYVIAPSDAKRIEFDDPATNITGKVTKFYEPSDKQYAEAPSIDNSCKFGGGAVNATPTEIAKIYNTFFSGDLTDETPLQVSSSLPDKISFGGEGLGGRSALVAYPGENLTVVIVANARGGNLQPYANEIADLFRAM